MKHSGRIWFCLVCAVAFSARAHAEDPVKAKKPFLHKFHPIAMPGAPGVPQPGQSPAAMAPPATPPQSSLPTIPQPAPYNSIAARNVFGLNPIPPPVTPDPMAGVQPPKISLTGITTIFGPSEALYKVAGHGQPGQPPVAEESYILQEGQEQDDVTVKAIDVKKGMVTFINHGVTQDILLAVGTASGGASPSGGSPQNSAGFGGHPGLNKFPTSNIRQNLQQRFGSNNPGNAGNNNNSANNFNPTASFNGGSSSPQAYNAVNGGYVNGVYTYGNQSSQSQLSAEDNAALIAAEHAQAQQTPGGIVAPSLYPPTPFDNEANQEVGGSSDSGQGSSGPAMPTLVPVKFPRR